MGDCGERSELTCLKFLLLFRKCTVTTVHLRKKVKQIYKNIITETTEIECVMSKSVGTGINKISK